MRIILSGLLVCFWLACSATAAELKDENLLQKLPQGFKVGYRANQNGVMISEMVPTAETVESWTEMITTQIFFGKSQISPEQFRQSISSRWKQACPKSSFHQMADGKENGYVFAYFMMHCPLNPNTNKPEITLVKAIQGNDSFYVVQKAWRSTPRKESLASWGHYMRTVKVCDTRLKDRPC